MDAETFHPPISLVEIGEDEDEEETSGVYSNYFIVEEEEEETGGDRVTIVEDEPNSPTRKALKQADRISALPDAISLRILSLMPTKYAVRTGLLSKRWHFLWTGLPDLSFVYKNVQGSPQELDDFFQFIDKTLVLHSSEKIHRFCLDFYYSIDGQMEYFASAPKMESRLSLWLRFATLRKVEDLHLQLYNCKYCINLKIPDFLYDYPSFTTLYTSGCDYPLPRGRPKVSWGLLKELTISETFIEAGVLQMILSGTPLLEYFKLHHCWVDEIDTASNLKLKTLVLDEALKGGADPEIPISIPTVTALEILGDCYNTQYKLLNASSLLEVTLDFEGNGRILFDYEQDQVVFLPKCCAQVWYLLQSLKHVKTLTVGIWCLRVVSALVTKAGFPPLSKNKCERLTLASHFQKWDIPGVASLLRNSPSLEKLVVDGRTRSFYYEFDNADYPVELKGLGSSLPHGPRYCWQAGFLKTIVIVGLEPDNHCMLGFIKVLLESANVLEKMEILAPTPSARNEDGNEIMLYYYIISQHLLSFPRSSPQAVVLLHK